MQSFLRDAKRYIRQVRSNGTARLPTMGLSAGEYWRNSPVSSKKLLRICGFDAAKAAMPPRGLLLPGPLSDRALQERSLCFLWFNERFFSRACGGGAGTGRACRSCRVVDAPSVYLSYFTNKTLFSKFKAYTRPREINSRDTRVYDSVKSRTRLYDTPLIQ